MSIDNMPGEATMSKVVLKADPDEMPDGCAFVIVVFLGVIGIAIGAFLLGFAGYALRFAWRAWTGG